VEGWRFSRQDSGIQPTSVDEEAAVLSLVYQPVVYFQARLRRPPSWRLAVGGPLGCAVLAIVSQVVLTAKITGPIADMLTGMGVSPAFIASIQYMGIVNAAFAYVLVWLMTSLFLISWDVLCRPSGDGSRILETNALAFYSQWPWLATLIALAVLFQPPPAWSLGQGSPSGSDLDRFRRLLEQDAFLVAVRATNECFTAWLYGLFGIGYHAVTGWPLWASLLLSSSMWMAFQLLRYVL
jgi:hypothetical protein